VKDGDLIRIDANAGTLDLLVDAGELSSRKKNWKPRKTNYNAGALYKYAQLVGPARDGAVTHPGAEAETHVFVDL
jgi:dihydroxy-acid dehydratase